MDKQKFIEQVAAKNPAQPEFLQAVTEVVDSVWEMYEANPKFKEAKIMASAI